MDIQKRAIKKGDSHSFKTTRDKSALSVLESYIKSTTTTTTYLFIICVSRKAVYLVGASLRKVFRIVWLGQ